MFKELAGFLIFACVIIFFLECWGQRTADKMKEKWDKKEEEYRKQTKK